MKAPEKQYDFVNGKYELHQQKIANSAKLKPDDVRSIRKDKRPRKEIATEHNISTTTVRNIQLLRSWGWLLD